MAGLALTVGACIPMVSDPGVILRVTNATQQDRRITYVQSGGNRTYAVAALTSGRLNTFPAPEDSNSVVVFDADCRKIAQADVPEAGVFSVTIDIDSVRVVPLSESEVDFSSSALPEAEPCTTP